VVATTATFVDVAGVARFVDDVAAFTEEVAALEAPEDEATGVAEVVSTEAALEEEVVAAADELVGTGAQRKPEA